jgi:carbon starvation protein
MEPHPLLIAILAGVGFLVAYNTYGRWLGKKIFRLSAEAVVPSRALQDDNDYVPTPKSVVFGHHFTSIAGTGPIVGPAIAVMWGWLPALIWVVLGSIFIGAVHDFGSLVVSLRNQGKSVGDVAGVVINKRVRILFLSILFVCLLIVCAIFGLVIAAVFRQYPAAIFPCTIQIPIAVAIGVWLHRRGVNLVVPSIIALVIMYATTFYGDVGWLHTFNMALAAWPTWVWVAALLAYGFVASVLPVWALLQPRDYINSLQLLSALGLIVVGIIVASIAGGAPTVEGAERPALAMVAPAVNLHPAGAPPIWPFLFITIACGAVSGFHCLVSSGTSSKQLACEPDARFVGYGAMLTEGFLAVLVILACGAGLGLGVTVVASQSATFPGPDGGTGGVTARRGAVGYHIVRPHETAGSLHGFVMPGLDGAASVGEPFDMSAGWGTGVRGGVSVERLRDEYGVLLDEEGAIVAVGSTAYLTRYKSWTSADGLGAKVGAFVDGAGNFVASTGLPRPWAIALMAVLVASFAGTTLDTAIRLQRYVVQELLGTLLPPRAAGAFVGETGLTPEASLAAHPSTGGAAGSQYQRLPASGLDSEAEGGQRLEASATGAARQASQGTADELCYQPIIPGRPSLLSMATNAYFATAVAVATAAVLAAIPASGEWSFANAGTGGLILWPLFGASNQLLAGLAFAVILFYLRRRRIVTWFMIPPMLFMLIVPAWAMLAELPNWWSQQRYVISALAVICLALETWMAIEAALLYGKIKGVPEGTTLGRGFDVLTPAPPAA